MYTVHVHIQKFNVLNVHLMYITILTCTLHHNMYIFHWLWVDEMKIEAVRPCDWFIEFLSGLNGEHYLMCCYACSSVLFVVRLFCWNAVQRKLEMIFCHSWLWFTELQFCKGL